MKIDTEKLKELPQPKKHSVGKEMATQMMDAIWWRGLSSRQIVEFQLFTAELTMPFPVFHKALEEVLGRPVWTHEMAFGAAALQQEFLGEKPAPTWEEILNIIPTEKRAIVEVMRQTDQG